MKKLLLLLLLFSCTGLYAQQEKYYDWRWKASDAAHSRFMSVIKKTDSGWLRNDFFTGNGQLQMSGLYKDSTCKIREGYFKYYYSNGRMEMYGRQKNGRREGLWLSYHRNGMIKDSAFYENNQPVGITMAWHNNGYQSDSNNYYTNTNVKWFDNGQPAEAGHFLKEKLDGKWQFFHKNGNLASVAKYENGNRTELTIYDEDGKEMADTGRMQNDAVFKGGVEAWKRYLVKQVYFPPNYNLVNSDIVTVVIEATIDEDGNVQDAAVSIPFKPEFDKIALNALKRSPKWKPAMSHNRRIKQVVYQPISFSQE